MDQLLLITFRFIETARNQIMNDWNEIRIRSQNNLILVRLKSVFFLLSDYPI